MRYINIIFILSMFLFSSCSPLRDNPVTEDQISKLELKQAVEDWKCSEGMSDECSSPTPIRWLADNFLNKSWEDCCYQHDFDYNFGWAYDITKDQADYELWSCVKDSGHPFIANLIYDGVRLGGWKFYQKGPKEVL